MKMRNNKGKVYPSSSSSSSSSSPFPAISPAGDSLSVLNLLPAAFLSLAVVVLSLEDREVLAYMITRSIKSSNPNPRVCCSENKKKMMNNHKSPVFECDCFDCYTNYWFKWDTSVNRELIHQAIEAFEENLNRNEIKSKKNKSKKKLIKEEKNSHRRFAGKTASSSPDVLTTTSCETKHDVALVQTEPESEPEGEDCSVSCTEETPEKNNQSPEKNEQSPEKMVVNGKGLGKKIMPDVIGLFNWRLWSIWGPNV
ncbi:hypothetical protein QVD17_29409 [Tagetes erecta]|uniref:Uncharacterized protein n=1 Tax=Tagetes erecta TaxID=13708 RepID=A0AAD8KBU5_TARER|nr:hypothetical protein QVD17_29409 [Tagetes erecta]